MKRNINTNIEINSKKIIVSAIENIGRSSYVEVYSNFTNFSLNDPSFIEKCIKEIEGKFGTVIDKVSVVLAQSNNVKAEIIQLEKIKKTSNNLVTLSDINTLKEWIEEEANTQAKIVTLVQPYNYEVYNDYENSKLRSSRKFKKAPIGVSGDVIKMTAIVTLIDRNIFNYIHEFLSKAGLKISQLLLNSQAEMFCSLSEIAQNEGGLLFRVGEDRTTISAVKHYATIKSVNLTPFGMGEIYTHLAKKYGITYNLAKSNVLIYGTFEENEIEKVIPIQNNIKDIKTNTFSNLEINQLLKEFIDYLIKKVNHELSEEITSKSPVPLVLSGEITKIRGYEAYVTEKMGLKYVSKYNPMTYAETNSHTLRSLGMSKYFDKVNEVHHADINLTIDTNPDSMKVLWNSIESQSNTKKLPLIKRLISRLGEKYGYQ